MKSGKMSDDKETREVNQFYAGAKILVPFFITIILTGIGYWRISAKNSEEKGKLEQRVIQLEKQVARNTEAIDGVDEELQELNLVVVEINSDVKHVKEDTKETLNLMRSLTGRNRN